jgi:hypothetical protein
MHFAAMLLQSTPDAETVQKMLMAIIPLFLLLFVVGLVIVILPFWFICKKAGFSPWLSLLNVVPFGNLVLVYVLAFADWKVIPAPLPAWPLPPPPPQA